MNASSFTKIGRIPLLILLAAAPATMLGCQSAAGTGALVGGAAGAGIGAIIGRNSHHQTATGALVGGAVGALGGALIGHQVDKQNAANQNSAVGGDTNTSHSYSDESSANDNATSPTPAASPQVNGYYASVSTDATVTASTPAGSASMAGAMTMNDVIAMSRHGDSDDAIIDRIDSLRAAFHLSAEDENRLRDANVSENVIRKMKDTDMR